MAKAKSNYTAEMTANLVESYTEVRDSFDKAEWGTAEAQEARDAVVSEFAETFGFHAASIRSKLVREGEYVAKVNLTKQGTTPEKKEAIVSQIAGFIGMTEEACDSLAKATKPVLQALRDTLTPDPVQVEEVDEGASEA